jgi:hypothetical protein
MGQGSTLHSTPEEAERDRTIPSLALGLVVCWVLIPSLALGAGGLQRLIPTLSFKVGLGF